jgi:hypothetical protein
MSDSDKPKQNYACGQCGSSFASMGELQSHLSAAHDE